MIDVRELKPGDRVLLRAEGAQVKERRGEFRGIAANVDGIMGKIRAMAPDPDSVVLLGIPKRTVEFIERLGCPAACFQLYTEASGIRHGIVLAVEPDGALRDVDGPRITVEAKLGRVNAG